jgi:hypothetical protein
MVELVAGRSARENHAKGVKITRRVQDGDTIC